MSITRWLMALLLFAPMAFLSPVAAQTTPQQYVVVYVEFLPNETLQGGIKLQQLAALAHKATGLATFQVVQEIQRPNFYSLVEIWDSATDYQNFIASSQTTALLNAIQPLLEAPFDTRPGNLVE